MLTLNADEKKEPTFLLFMIFYRVIRCNAEKKNVKFNKRAVRYNFTIEEFLKEENMQYHIIIIQYSLNVTISNITIAIIYLSTCLYVRFYKSHSIFLTILVNLLTL